MKNILFIIIFTAIALNALSQRTQLDFTFQLQNTVNYDAVIFPNPIFEPVFKIKSNYKIDKVEIINMLGTVVYFTDVYFATEEIKVTLPNIEKNVYLVKIIFEDNNFVIKKLFYK